MDDKNEISSVIEWLSSESDKENLSFKDFLTAVFEGKKQVPFNIASNFKNIAQNIVDSSAVYKVCWIDIRCDVCTEHGEFLTWVEAFQSIKDWWKANNFEPRLVRHWSSNNRTTIDYGSHYQFYQILKVVKE